MSTVKVLGYSERGIINSIVFFLKEQPKHIKEFIKVLGIEDDFFDDVCEYTFLNEQSFSDFGSNDWTIIAQKDNVKRVVFIEAKRGKSYKIEEEFKKINAYCIGSKEYEGVSSNIFAQLYYKFLLTQMDEDNEFKVSKIGKEVKKLGGNEVVKKAYNEYIKETSVNYYYYVAILPKEVEGFSFSEKFGSLELGMPISDVTSVNWGKIEQFFTDIKATSVIENFNFNKGQIY